MSDEMFASPKSRTTTQILAVVLGWCGGHRFYTGKIWTGILMALTGGGFTLWWLYDNIVIATGGFRDKEGRLVSNWDHENERLVPPGTAAGILDELDALRAEVGELQERVAFSERLLSDPGRRSRAE